jgi:hypothetical protein
MPFGAYQHVNRFQKAPVPEIPYWMNRSSMKQDKKACCCVFFRIKRLGEG